MPGIQVPDVMGSEWVAHNATVMLTERDAIVVYSIEPVT